MHTDKFKAEMNLKMNLLRMLLVAHDPIFCFRRLRHPEAVVLSDVSLLQCEDFFVGKDYVSMCITAKSANKKLIQNTSHQKSLSVHLNFIP
jgi:hypothetical protein